MSLKDMVNTLKGRLENIARDSERAAKEIEDLKERIKSGDSTGDELTDFCVVQLGALTNPVVTKWDEELKANSSGLILKVSEEQHITGCPGILPPNRIPRENILTTRKYEIGVGKQGYKWDASSGHLVVNMQYNLIKNNHSQWKKVDSNLHVEWRYLDRPLFGTSLFGDGLSSRYELFLGEKAENELDRRMLFSADKVYVTLDYIPTRGFMLEHDKPKKKDPLRM